MDRVESTGTGDESPIVGVKRLERELASARAKLTLEEALDRVREKAMTMESSSDIGETTLLMFDEMKAFLPGILRSGVLVMTPPDELLSWLAGMDGDGNRVLLKGIPIRRGDVPEAAWMLDAWLEDRHLSFLESQDFLQFVVEKGYHGDPTRIVPVDAPHDQYFSQFNHKSGCVFVVADHPIEEASDEGRIVRRFSRTYDVAYRRYMDLSEAEAHAREARIEAAVERVRARAMSMRQSDELMDTACVVFEQLTSLGFDPYLSAWEIYDDETESAESWITFDPEARRFFSAQATYEQFLNDPLNIAHLASWRKKEPFFTKVLEGEVMRANISFLSSLKEQQRLTGSLPSLDDADRLYASAARFNRGYLTIGTEKALSTEQLSILGRLAGGFELVYRRFEDLKKAEAQAREAQIEAGLERVRSQSMAMTKSRDLLDITVTIHAEFSRLGFTPGFVWHMRWGETTYEKASTTIDGSRLESVMMLPRHFSGVKALEEWEFSEEPMGVFMFDPDAAVDYVQKMVEKGRLLEIHGDPPKTQEIIDMGGFTFVQARTAHGELGYFLPGQVDPEPEAKEIFLRFAGVFDMAYRRFEDLQKAEAQAREAQIEAAMERIRASAMAMHTSEDFYQVIVELRRQMDYLDQHEICAIHLYDDDPESILSMSAYRRPTAPDEIATTRFRIPRRGLAIIDEVLARYDSDETDYVVVVDGEANLEWREFLRTVTPEVFEDFRPVLEAGDDKPVRAYWAFSDFAGGSMGLVTHEPPDAESLGLVRRAANVFDLAYRRYKDLKQAEAQAREAQIEASLERVRSRTMAMQRSKELADVVGTIFSELTQLDFVLTRCIIWVFDEGHNASWWMANPEMESGAESYDVPYNEHPSYLAFLQAWQRREPILLYTLAGSEKEEYDDFLFAETGLARLPEIAQEGMREPDAVYLSNASNDFGSLMVASLDPLSDENLDIVQRFGRVFQQSYTRFIDVQQAEAAARESRIEASLERVRAHAMGMQKPDDISDVSILMFDEMEALGIESLRSGISIPFEGERYEFHAATKKKDGTTTLVLGNESVNVYPIIRRAYDGWKEQEEYQVTTLEGEDLVEYYNAVFVYSLLPGWEERMKTGAESRECFATFPFADGWLYTFMRHDITDEEIDLHIRFARAFGLAYQRYHDLKKAEEDYKALLEEKARTEKALTDLRATQKQLVEQEKLASLGSLTAGIAHEIKNPLNFVNNFAEVSTELVEELSEAVASGDTEQVQSILKEISDNAAQIAKHGKRADSIVKAMMQHARGGSSDPELVNLNEFLEEYINLSWHGMRARDHGFQADVVRRFDEGVGEIRVQPQEMGRVILNLLNNAFDALKGQDTAKVTVTTRRTKGQVEILVADNGPGIPAEIREKIFEPFFTTKATGEGTGLGLSLSYDIVTKGHNGQMRIGESPEGGAEFQITLPS